MIRAIIIDDERLARNELKKLLMDFPEIEVIAEAANASEGVEKIDSLNPDLIFLDIQLPGITGMNFLRSLVNPPLVVLTTAYAEYALESYEFNVIDYLLKPVSQNRLQRALQRARALHGNKRQLAENAAKLADATAPATLPHTRKVVGRRGDEYFLLDIKDILAFQAKGELVWIITSTSRFLATQSLRKIETHLKDPPFQRVHRNAIVNVNHVRKMSAMSSQRWLLTLSNSQQLVVSKRQARTLQHMLRW